jgi:hypothetical protein
MPSAWSTTCVLHHQLDKARHYRAEKCQEATSASFATQPVFELACSEMDQLLCPEPKQFNFYLITIDQSSASDSNTNNSQQTFDIFSDKKVVTFVDDVDLHKWFWKLRWATCSANRY